MNRMEAHVLLSEKPEPVAPPPELAATVILRVDGADTLQRHYCVLLSFQGRSGTTDYSIRIKPEYAYRLGEALCAAGRQAGF